MMAEPDLKPCRSPGPGPSPSPSPSPTGQHSHTHSHAASPRDELLTHVVAREVLEEAARDNDLLRRLEVVLRRHALHQPREELKHLHCAARCIRHPSMPRTGFWGTSTETSRWQPARAGQHCVSVT